MFSISRSLCGAVRLVPFLMFPCTVFSQQKKSERTPHVIEISAYGRHDQYQATSTYYLYGDDMPYQYSVRGISSGASITYKYPVMRNTYLKLGGGIYKHNFNKIQTTHSGSVPRKSMHYIYPDVYLPLVYADADQYWANVYTANIGAEYAYPAGPGFLITVGINLSTYFLRETVVQFGQDRRLPEFENGQMKKEGSGYFGQSFYLQAGVMKRIGPVGFGPYIMLPVIDSWSTIDENLAGDGPGVRRQKALEGIGVGFTLAFMF